MDIEYTLEVQPDDVPVRGNAAASGDDVEDRAVEDEILRRLDAGDVWAWCLVTVRARLEVDGERFTGYASLGACNYDGEQDWRASNWVDMKAEALDDLLSKLDDAVNRGEFARSLRVQIRAGADISHVDAKFAIPIS